MPKLFILDTPGSPSLTVFKSLVKNTFLNKLNTVYVFKILKKMKLKNKQMNTPVLYHGV